MVQHNVFCIRVHTCTIFFSLSYTSYTSVSVNTTLSTLPSSPIGGGAATVSSSSEDSCGLSTSSGEVVGFEHVKSFVLSLQYIVLLVCTKTTF